MTLMKDVIKLITNDGWQLISMRGPHWQFVHPSKPGRVTISGHLSHKVGSGTLKSVLRQCKLSVKKKKHHGALSGSR